MRCPSLILPVLILFVAGADNPEVAKLAQGLKSKKAVERAKAAEGLEKLGKDGAGAIGPVCDALAVERIEAVRVRLLAALHEISPSLAKPITELIVGDDLSARSRAMQTLAGLQDEARPALRLLAALSRGTLMAALNGQFRRGGGALGMLGTPGFVHSSLDTFEQIEPTDPEYIKLVFDLCKLSTPLPNPECLGIRSIALQHLPALVKANPQFKKQAVTQLIAALDERGTQAGAINALKNMGPDAKDAIPALKKLLLSPDARMRQVVADALQKIQVND